MKPTTPRPKLGEKVTAIARMRRAHYDFDPNADRDYENDDDWIAGPRWVRVLCDLTGIYCGTKRLHQVVMSWEEDTDSGRHYVFPRGDIEMVEVCIVALSHTKRANVLPTDVIRRTFGDGER